MNIVKKEQSWLMTISLVVLAALAIGIILIFAKKILIPFVLAVFVFQISSPILDFQVLRLKWPRSLAVVFTLLIVGLFMALLSYLMADAMFKILAAVREYGTYFLNFVDKVFAWLDQLTTKFDVGFGFGKADPNAVMMADPNIPEAVIQEPAAGNPNELLRNLVVQGVQKGLPIIISNAWGTITGFLSGFVLVSIFVIFLLIGRNPHIAQKGIYADIDHGVRHYLTIKTLMSAATGTLVWIILSLFGLPLAGVFGILAFLLNFIPSIGSIIATLLPIPIAVAQYHNPWFAALVVACPGAVQMVIGNGIEPRMMGKGLNLHPITVLLALAFWGLLWGIPGMFLAVPMTAVIRIVLMQFETLRPVGLLLAGRLPEAEVEQMRVDMGAVPEPKKPVAKPGQTQSSVPKTKPAPGAKPETKKDGNALKKEGEK